MTNLDFIFNEKTKNIKTCKKCGHTFKYYQLKKTPRSYTCSPCGNIITPIADTLIKKSKDVDVWFKIIDIIVLNPNIKIQEIATKLNKNYKTVWRIYHLLLHKIEIKKYPSKILKKVLIYRLLNK